MHLYRALFHLLPTQHLREEPAMMGQLANCLYDARHSKKRVAFLFATESVYKKIDLNS
jgi:hypothetical protein